LEVTGLQAAALADGFKAVGWQTKCAKTIQVHTYAHSFQVCKRVQNT
jgi:hypothetical protein